MNRTQIKTIAIIAMLIDHIASVFVPENLICYDIMRVIGRITAPIMCYFLVEGYEHTRSKWKYGCRLLIFAFLSQIPYSLIFENHKLNFLFNILLSFLMLCGISFFKEKLIKIIIICLIMTLCYFCDWSVWCPLMVLCFWRAKQRERYSKSNIIFRKYSKFNIFMRKYGEFAIIVCIRAIMKSTYQFGSLLAVPILMSCNGKDITNKKYKTFSKYFFYAFYPLHLIVLYGISHI